MEVASLVEEIPKVNCKSQRSEAGVCLKTLGSLLGKSREDQTAEKVSGIGAKDQLRVFPGHVKTLEGFALGVIRTLPLPLRVFLFFVFF